MSTLLGIGIFSAAAAFAVDKIYNSLVDSASGVAEAGRYAAFTGTWTTVSAATSMRGVSKKAGQFKGRIRSVRNLISR